MSEQTRICAGASVGALIGAAVAYLFFTDGGRIVRSRLEPIVDELPRKFDKFRRAIETVWVMASDGFRALEEFQNARAGHHFSNGGTAL